MQENTPCIKCFESLGVSSRMKIYKFLKKNGRGSVSAVVDVVKLTQPTVSYHLKEMKGAGLLNSSKAGREVFYSINEDCPSNAVGCFLAKSNF
jgi:DNA-binding transcriptional ArsR family regulator